jgi:hypothetical protein
MMCVVHPSDSLVYIMLLTGRTFSIPLEWVAHALSFPSNKAVLSLFFIYLKTNKAHRILVKILSVR